MSGDAADAARASGLESMTGFGRAQSAGSEGIAGALAWEARSVNGKGLDVRLRLPPGMERLEQPARLAAAGHFARGSIQLALTASRSAAQAQPVINEAFLRDIAGLAKRLEEQFGLAPATADGILALRGVLDIPEATDTQASRDGFDALALSTLDTAFAELKASRRAEGEALRPILLGRLDRIEQLAGAAEADPARDPARIKERLREQVRLLLDASPPLDEARLAAEAAFLAAKADIREELDRLNAHVASARKLLAEGGPVGRKLDFLAQEFNRESNTLCSKSNAASVTAIGLELKLVVDQFREQVQNLE